MLYDPHKAVFFIYCLQYQNYALKCIENQANPAEAYSLLSMIYSLLAIANLIRTALKHAIAR